MRYIGDTEEGVWGCSHMGISDHKEEGGTDFSPLALEQETDCINP